MKSPSEKTGTVSNPSPDYVLWARAKASGLKVNSKCAPDLNHEATTFTREGDGLTLTVVCWMPADAEEYEEVTRLVEKRFGPLPPYDPSLDWKGHKLQQA